MSSLPSETRFQKVRFFVRRDNSSSTTMVVGKVTKNMIRDMTGIQIKIQFFNMN
jgi:hypothetical protein